MRRAVLVLTVVVMGLLSVLAAGRSRVPLPAVGPFVEPLCAETIRSSVPDLTWTADGHDRSRRAGEPVPFGELPLHDGQRVRVAGFLHVEYQLVAIYPSRTALTGGKRGSWIDFAVLWPDEPYVLTKGPTVSDRCAIVEGTYRVGPSGHFAAYGGSIRDVVRLDVWSSPHRPVLVGPRTAPPRPPAARPSRPRRPTTQAAHFASTPTNSPFHQPVPSSRR